MKICLISLISLMFSSCYSQIAACDQMKTGRFLLDSTVSGETYISRTEKHQIEENADLKIKMQYDIVWIDDCTYELRNAKVLSGDSNFAGDPSDVLTTEIIKVEGTKMYVTTKANFSDFVSESIITKLE